MHVCTCLSQTCQGHSNPEGKDQMDECSLTHERDKWVELRESGSYKHEVLFTTSSSRKRLIKGFYPQQQRIMPSFPKCGRRNNLYNIRTHTHTMYIHTYPTKSFRQ